MKPLAVSSGKKTDTGVTFVNGIDTVDIECTGAAADLLLSLTASCSGLLTASELQKELNLEQDQYDFFIKLLASRGVVVDSRELYTYFHRYSQFPLLAAHDWNKENLEKSRYPKTRFDTPLHSLLSKRKSTRSFDGTSLKGTELDHILDAMYQVPSAGGIRPLRLLTFFPQEQKNQLIETMLGTDMVKNAGVVIFIVGDFSKTEYKYGNRAYRHLLLEAGHMAQNAYLSAAEQGIGICEYGGFNDEELAKVFELDYPREAILTVLFAGHISDTPFSEEFASKEYNLRKCLTKKKIVRGTQHSVFSIKDYTMPYYVASTRYFRNKKEYTSFGIGTSLSEAKFKSLAEAHERHVSGLFRCDFEGEVPPGEFLNLPNYQSEQYRSSKDLVPRTGSIKWVQSDTGVYIPCDEVFFPVSEKQLGHKLTTLANSTGVATHSDRSKAVENAVLELIERDAIAVTWYSKTPPPHIYEYPDEVKKRVVQLKARGHLVWLFDISTDSVPVVMCTITSPSYPRTVTGYGAAFKADDSIVKALNEAEMMLHSWARTDRDPITPEQVSGSTSHGDYNAHLNALQHPDTSWLFSGLAGTIEDSSLSPGDLIAMYNCVVVDLANVDCSDLQTVRVLFPILMPITFGYGSEHRNHPRIEQLGRTWAWDGVAHPHLLA